MMVFLVYAGSLAGSVFAFRKARALFRNSKVLLGALFLLLCGISMFVFVSNHPSPAAAAANAPIGTAKGIFPGRVTWVYNQVLLCGEVPETIGAATVNPQAEYNKAFTAGVENLSGGTNDSTSWDKIFKYFNANHGRTGTGYQLETVLPLRSTRTIPQHPLPTPETS